MCQECSGCNKQIQKQRTLPRKKEKKGKNSLLETARDNPTIVTTKQKWPQVASLARVSLPRDFWIYVLSRGELVLAVQGEREKFDFFFSTFGAVQLSITISKK